MLSMFKCWGRHTAKRQREARIRQRTSSSNTNPFFAGRLPEHDGQRRLFELLSMAPDDTDDGDDRDEAILTLLDEFPELAHSPYANVTRHGAASDRTLLHWVCSLGGSLALIRGVHKHFPSAVFVEGEYMRLPLHDACRGECPVEAIHYLVRAYPAAVHCIDQYGKLPWTYAFFRHSKRRELLESLRSTNVHSTLTLGRLRWDGDFPNDFLDMAVELLTPRGLHLTLLEEMPLNEIFFNGMSLEGTLNISIQAADICELMPTLGRLKSPIVKLILEVSRPVHEEVVTHLPFIETLVVDAMYTPQQLSSLLTSVQELDHLKSLVLNGTRDYQRNECMMTSTFDGLHHLTDLERIFVKAFPTATMVPAIARLMSVSTKLTHVTLACPLDDHASQLLATALASSTCIQYLQLDRRVNADMMIAALRDSNYTLLHLRAALATVPQTTEMDYYCRLNQLNRQALANVQTTRREAVQIFVSADDVSFLYSLLRFRPALWSL